MNTVRTPKETAIDQEKLEGSTPMKNEQGWNGFHSVSAAEDIKFVSETNMEYTHAEINTKQIMILRRPIID